MKKITSLFISALSRLALVTAANVSITAHAADQLQTIIVTASKIETDIQQTPVSMQSLSGETLSNLGVTSVDEIAKFTPGLQMDETGGGISATVRIRGVGTPGLSALDPSIPIFIDGVAQARTGSGFQDLLDVARVEVLRGPQGTLYGRNSTVGAINVFTKDANSHQWGGSLQVQAGNYNDRELKGTVNIPMVEGLLAARISAFSVKQDGYITDVPNDKTENGYADREGGRAKIALTPSNDLSINWITAYTQSTSHPGEALVIIPSIFSQYATQNGIVSQGGTHVLPHDDAYNGKVYSNLDNWAYDTNFATSVTVNWDMEEGPLADNSLTSITAYGLTKNRNSTDLDASILDYNTNNGSATTQSWSQELRISSDAGEHLEYVAGLYYYAEHLLSFQNTNTYLSDAIATAAAFPAAFGGAPADANTKDWFNTDNAAVFGQATYAFTPKFSLTAGLRQSWVQKRGNSYLTVTPFNINKDIVDHLTQIETDTSGVLKGSYFLDDDIMLYASYDRGFKPGGFNRAVFATPPPPQSYHKEVANNYEIGVKSQWFDRRLQANIDAFYMDFQGFHDQTIDQINNLVVENIPKVTNEGIEFDLQALATAGLTIGVGGAYNNPRVRSDVVEGSQLHKGGLITDASQYSANLNAEYSHKLSNGPAEGFVHIDTAYRSRYILGDQRDDHFQGGYSLCNIRFGVRNFEGHWQLTGWVKNIFDKEYAVYAFSRFSGQTDGLYFSQGAPRTYGMTLQYDY